MISKQENLVFIQKLKRTVYPKDRPFNPSVKYPEYPFHDISIEENEIYASIRNIFLSENLDVKNYGTNSWNPLGKFINPGQTI